MTNDKKNSFSVFGLTQKKKFVGCCRSSRRSAGDPLLVVPNFVTRTNAQHALVQVTRPLYPGLPEWSTRRVEEADKVIPIVDKAILIWFTRTTLSPATCYQNQHLSVFLTRWRSRWPWDLTFDGLSVRDRRKKGHCVANSALDKRLTTSKSTKHTATVTLQGLRARDLGAPGHVPPHSSDRSVNQWVKRACSTMKITLSLGSVHGEVLPSWDGRNNQWEIACRYGKVA